MSRILSSRLSIGMFASVLLCTAAAAPAIAGSYKFKVTNVHFETNSSGCDMGIQIAFDTEGLTQGSVTDPNGKQMYSFKSGAGMKATGGQTEGFLEGIEPQLKELMNALGCAPSKEEGTSTLAKLFAEFPQGEYTFSGLHNGVPISGTDALTYQIPAGPDVTAPSNGAIVPLQHASINWKPVTGPILPYLGPVTITGYHVIVYQSGGEVVPELDVDVPADRTSLKIPRQFLKPATQYLFEVLSSEKSGNQTITEGYFCTEGISSCATPPPRRHR